MFYVYWVFSVFSEKPLCYFFSVYPPSSTLEDTFQTGQGSTCSAPGGKVTTHFQTGWQKEIRKCNLKKGDLNAQSGEISRCWGKHPHHVGQRWHWIVVHQEDLFAQQIKVDKIINRYSWVNLVVPKNWAAYFSAITGRKFDLTTVLRSRWPIEWRRRGFIAPFSHFFSLLLMKKTTFQWSKVVSEAIFPTN